LTEVRHQGKNTKIVTKRRKRLNATRLYF